MTMVSFAQNAEDVVLRRLFPADHRGLYIDVGASHPLENTVTRYFYEQGWQGINIEPGEIFHRLVEHRPRDVNLNVGLSNAVGTQTFYEFVDYPGSSTYNPHEAEVHRREHGFHCRERAVPVTTLKSICEEHVVGPIDFISIDVEGHERQVLEGGDWSRFRPLVLVIEATRPNSTTPTHDRWEDILFAADYRFALFDGLNRYYLRAEDSHLLERLASPVNCCDDYIPHYYRRRIDELESRLAFAEARLAAANHRLSAAADHLALANARLSAIEGLGPRSLTAARKIHDWAVPFHRLSSQVKQIVSRAS